MAENIPLHAMARRSQTRRTLMELPEDIINKIIVLVAKKSSIALIKCRLVCTTFNRSAETEAVYKNIETDSLRSARFCGKEGVNKILQRCREVGNPNTNFMSGMMMYFFLGDDAGQLKLEAASSEGQRDATLALGMIMMAGGRGMKSQAMQMLNAAFPCSSSRTEDISRSMSKVEQILAREDGRRVIRFHGCLLTCTQHHGGKDLGFAMRSTWLFHCDVCVCGKLVSCDLVGYSGWSTKVECKNTCFCVLVECKKLVHMF